jgi:hypothetical protein
MLNSSLFKKILGDYLKDKLFNQSPMSIGTQKFVRLGKSGF